MSDSKPQGAPVPPAGQTEKANGTTMVVVGCKLPNGLIMEVGKVGDDRYTQVRLRGTNDSNIVGGYGLTEVSKEFWDEWFKKNKNLSFVKKGFVFAHGDMASARDVAKERTLELTGLEPLNPHKDERVKANKDESGKPLVEVDMDHWNNARRNVADATSRMAR
jgi:hypothetical protein